MRKSKWSVLSVAAAFATGLAGSALAHHPSPADPDIGDMQGMHEEAISDMLDNGARNGDGRNGDSWDEDRQGGEIRGGEDRDGGFGGDTDNGGGNGRGR